MNTWQAARRIRNILQARLWKDTGTNVFAPRSVRVTQTPAAGTVPSEIRVPAAFVRIMPRRNDRDRPTQIEQDLSIVLLVSAPGDMIGEAPLIGGRRKSDTKSGGRGILEIETEMYAAIEKINASNQFEISAQGSGAAQPIMDEDSNYHVSCEYFFEAMLSTKLRHLEPRLLTLAEATGTVTIDWEAPDDTTNLVGYVVRRMAGTVPAAFIDEGTGVAVSPITDTITTDTPGAGTYTYSIFAIYDDLGGSVHHHHSDIVYASIVVP